MIEGLNLYAGIGGNRKNWKNIRVTAVELNKEIAKIYKERFPQDTVIIGDAHEYLIKNYKKYDFIWSSPMCPSHSRARKWAWGDSDPVYPDMSLYQEIILLKYYFKGKYVVENVIPYYTPLIKPTAIIGRHYFWSNFRIPPYHSEKANIIHKGTIADLEELHGVDLGKYKTTTKKKIKYLEIASIMK